MNATKNDILLPNFLLKTEATEWKNPGKRPQFIFGFWDRADQATEETKPPVLPESSPVPNGVPSPGKTEVEDRSVARSLADRVRKELGKGTLIRCQLCSSPFVDTPAIPIRALDLFLHSHEHFRKSSGGSETPLEIFLRSFPIFSGNTLHQEKTNPETEQISTTTRALDQSSNKCEKEESENENGALSLNVTGSQMEEEASFLSRHFSFNPSEVAPLEPAAKTQLPIKPSQLLDQSIEQSSIEDRITERETLGESAAVTKEKYLEPRKKHKKPLRNAVIEEASILLLSKSEAKNPVPQSSVLKTVPENENRIISQLKSIPPKKRKKLPQSKRKGSEAEKVKLDASMSQITSDSQDLEGPRIQSKQIVDSISVASPTLSVAISTLKIQPVAGKMPNDQIPPKASSSQHTLIENLENPPLRSQKPSNSASATVPDTRTTLEPVMLTDPPSKTNLAEGSSPQGRIASRKRRLVQQAYELKAAKEGTRNFVGLINDIQEVLKRYVPVLPPTFPCSECGDKFQQRDLLQDFLSKPGPHILFHLSPEPYWCSQCLVNVSDRVDHWNGFHAGDRSPVAGPSEIGLGESGLLLSPKIALEAEGMLFQCFPDLISLNIVPGSADERTKVEPVSMTQEQCNQKIPSTNPEKNSSKRSRNTADEVSQEKKLRPILPRGIAVFADLKKTSNVTNDMALKNIGPKRISSQVIVKKAIPRLPPNIGPKRGVNIVKLSKMLVAAKQEPSNASSSSPAVQGPSSTRILAIGGQKGMGVSKKLAPLKKKTRIPGKHEFSQEGTDHAYSAGKTSLVRSENSSIIVKSNPNHSIGNAVNSRAHLENVFENNPEPHEGLLQPDISADESMEFDFNFPEVADEE